MAKVNRRTALKTLGLATAGAVAGGTGISILKSNPPVEPSVNAQAVNSSTLLPFEGVHQAGVLTDPPEAVLLASLDVLINDRSDLVKVFQTVSGRIRELMSGQLGSSGDEEPDFPPGNTGALGFDPLKQGHLSVMLGMGAALFEPGRFGLEGQKPLALKPMPRDLAGDRLSSDFLDGDILLQISSDHPLYNLHALRDILRYTKGQLGPRWVQPGFQRFFEAGPGQAHARGLLGFKDGTANLKTTDSELMSKLVWTGSEEPGWAQGGTYVAVRKIREQIERWDRLTLNQQEASIGRRKSDGASLDNTTETAVPGYAADPEGEKIPLNAHIRKANPRLGEESDRRRMLRRGYLYFNGVDKSGLLDAGFLFMGFCRNVVEQFEFIKRNYMTNHNFPQAGTGVQDLDEYLNCVGGGYFFVPPGVKASDRFLADALLLG